MLEQISQDKNYAYAETLEILSLIDTNLTQKVPKKLIKVFQDNASTTYIKHLNSEIPLENQNISQKTASIITLLALNYWCNTKEEKSALKSILSENEKIYRIELEQKYNSNIIFNNNLKTNNQFINNKALQEDSELLPLDTSSLPWYKKIFFKINKLFQAKAKKSNNPL